ncbi:hypothetical protein PHMEG_00012325 [Phytophthora megakarya]|uniref:Reverse transcriptase n=1 Tax=Phytophthora megakarya TaxID=4795 RepID=A0A225W902_9STRA|nr:hypothetical protein PHMEG_00012325 [Phytophthora megakarya]
MGTYTIRVEKRPTNLPTDDQQLPVGFVELPPEEQALVDQDVLDYLKLGIQSPRDEMDVERGMTLLVEQMTVFRRNILAPSQMGPVLGRSSYIDDIAHGGPLSLPKSEFGKRVIPYLSHEIGAEGIRATPKIVKGKPPPVVSVEMLSIEYTGVVLNLDGAAKTSTRKGSCGCILWQLPE